MNKTELMAQRLGWNERFGRGCMDVVFVEPNELRGKSRFNRTGLETTEKRLKRQLAAIQK